MPSLDFRGTNYNGYLALCAAINRSLGDFFSVANKKVKTWRNMQLKNSSTTIFDIVQVDLKLYFFDP